MARPASEFLVIRLFVPYHRLFWGVRLREQERCQINGSISGSMYNVAEIISYSMLCDSMQD